ncbi:hypothetical protein EYF80_024334 [Liparis tanakae]|uniref:Uncharacterized protein n=1 Tax=Liparis tanakae TaxID=230148 RepID=A0A4Z2HJS0_9TELE|nr:hypothetical protein EYF80_024334 [Liparis tanakae]
MDLTSLSALRLKHFHPLARFSATAAASQPPGVVRSFARTPSSSSREEPLLEALIQSRPLEARLAAL